MPRKTRNKVVKVKILKKETLKYKCKLCYKSFHTVKAKQQHLLICQLHTQTYSKAVIRCKNCCKSFIYKQSYLQHLKTEHSKLKNSVACNACDVRCPNKETLEKHIMKTHESKKYSCPHCGMIFARSAHVDRHISQKGCGGFITEKHACEICGAWFSRKDNLMVHLRTMHIVDSRYKCKQCPTTVKTFSRLITHVINEHTEKPVFECDTCGKSTSSKAALVKHMEIHGEKKHNCDVCGYTTFTAEVMRRHILTHVRDKPYKCDHCSCSFIQVSQLRSHVINRHTNNYNCSYCGENYQKIEDYADHTQTHSPKPGLRCHFEGCPFSDKIFKTKHKLIVHLKTHFKEQFEDQEPAAMDSHSCSVCGKWFSSSLLARRHLDTHALDRARRCMYCVQARAYVRGQQLLRHVRKSHHDVFMAHLLHVRRVLQQGAASTNERLRKSEAEAVLNVMDAEAERILHGYGAGVLYGGMQQDRPQHIDIEVPALDLDNRDIAVEVEVENQAESTEEEVVEEEETALEEQETALEQQETALEEQQEETGAEEPERKPNGALLGDAELARNLDRLLRLLVDHDTLQQLGADHLPLHQLLERLISDCGVAVPAGAEGAGGAAARLRLLARLLVLHVLEDRALAAALRTRHIDHIICDLLHNLDDDQQPLEID